MKKKFCLSVFLFLILFITFVYKYNYNKSVSVNIESDYKKEKLLSMMLETEVGSGKYEVTTSNVWPTEGYVFNSELSGCENGSNLSWDDSNKTIIMSGNVSDKCYVYFDAYEPRYDENCDSTFLACNVAKKFTGVQGENSIYYHDSSLVNGAEDNSYRFAGASETVNNYVCFGSDNATCSIDNLYRIIGVFDGRVKLIKADASTSVLLGTDGDYKAAYSYDITNYKGNLLTSDIGGYYWNYNANGSSLNTWSTSLLNKTNLNTNYLNNIGSKWANMIDITIWKVGGNTTANINNQIPSIAYQNEIVNPVTKNSTDNATEYSAKVGLMYVSDYGFSAGPTAWVKKLGYDYDNGYSNSSVTSINWMYMGLYEYTISRDSYYSNSVFLVNLGGHFNSGPASNVIVVRPVFFLNSSIKYVSGSGTKSDPIRVTY